MTSEAPGIADVQSLLATSLVINGHGARTASSFSVGGHVLFAPHDLSTPYSLTMDFAIETMVRGGVLPSVRQGSWTTYGARFHRPDAPDVELRPWNVLEWQSFSRLLTSDPSLWSDIDGKTGLYASRDPHMKLVVRRSDQSLGVAASVRPVAGKPTFLFAPGVAKIKILDRVLLSEILAVVRQLSGERLVILATCNAAGDDDEELELSRDDGEIGIASILSTAPRKRVSKGCRW